MTSTSSFACSRFVTHHKHACKHHSLTHLHNVQYHAYAFDYVRFQENAGFKLLMKLGYKGGGLGKDGAGTTKPLIPELKQGRLG